MRIAADGRSILSMKLLAKVLASKAVPLYVAVRMLTDF
jgi:hypothetical protein